MLKLQIIIIMTIDEILLESDEIINYLIQKLLKHCFRT